MGRHVRDREAGTQAIPRLGENRKNLTQHCGATVKQYANEKSLLMYFSMMNGLIEPIDVTQNSSSG